MGKTNYRRSGARAQAGERPRPSFPPGSIGSVRREHAALAQGPAKRGGPPRAGAERPQRGAPLDVAAGARLLPAQRGLREVPLDPLGAARKHPRQEQAAARALPQRPRALRVAGDAAAGREVLGEVAAAGRAPAGARRLEEAGGAGVIARQRRGAARVGLAEAVARARAAVIARARIDRASVPGRPGRPTGGIAGGSAHAASAHAASTRPVVASATVGARRMGGDRERVPRTVPVGAGRALRRHGRGWRRRHAETASTTPTIDNPPHTVGPAPNGSPLRAAATATARNTGDRTDHSTTTSSSETERAGPRPTGALAELLYGSWRLVTAARRNVGTPALTPDEDSERRHKESVKAESNSSGIPSNRGRSAAAARPRPAVRVLYPV